MVIEFSRGHIKALNYLQMKFSCRRRKELNLVQMKHILDRDFYREEYIR